MFCLCAAPDSKRGPDLLQMPCIRGADRQLPPCDIVPKITLYPEQKNDGKRGQYARLVIGAPSFL